MVPLGGQAGLVHTATRPAWPAALSSGLFLKLLTLAHCEAQACAGWLGAQVLRALPWALV